MDVSYVSVQPLDDYKGVAATQMMETEATECQLLRHPYGSSRLCGEQCVRFCSLQNCAKKACNGGDCSCKRNTNDRLDSPTNHSAASVKPECNELRVFAALGIPPGFLNE
nr:unnamed protein product [Callosobruchus chinensis]